MKVFFDYKEVKFEVSLEDNESIISKEISDFGSWEPYQLDLYECLLSKDSVFVDIGANVGVNSLYAAKKIDGIRVFSIEGSPSTFEYLIKNVEGTSIEPINLVVSSADGFENFLENNTTGRICSGDNSNDSFVSVTSKTLDTLVEDLQLREIDLLKIDVEGFTDKVLYKSDTTLAITKYAIIEFSVHDVVGRFGCDDKKVVVENFLETIYTMERAGFAYYYYISRDGEIVKITSVNGLLSMIAPFSNVGDVLFSKAPFKTSIDFDEFIFKYVHKLMAENHQRMVSIEKLNSTLETISKNLLNKNSSSSNNSIFINFLSYLRRIRPKF